jgi:hypothetical protein
MGALGVLVRAKKRLRISPEPFIVLLLFLGSVYVCSLKTFRTIGDLESNAIAFSKGLESVTLDSGKMYEYVIAIFLFNKSKTLAVIKPFNCSVYH